MIFLGALLHENLRFFWAKLHFELKMNFRGILILQFFDAIFMH